MTRLVQLTVAVVAASMLLFSAAAATMPARAPRCFGAASRDPRHPCHNPALDFTVTPSEGVALLTPGEPCTLVSAHHPIVCAFGPPVSRSRRLFATVGDSHSAHWRGALAVVARRNRWRGYQLYQTSCPFSLTLTELRPLRFRQCEQWRRDVIAWLDTHPAVDTVFVSEHRVLIQTPPNTTTLDAEVAGYTAAWAALPATVKHIVVIRDTPYDRMTTNHCITLALARHRRPGIACEVPTRVAIHGDPAVVAARRLDSPRVKVVDLTHYFCGPRFCYPVVGGARVHIDDDHITRVFSETLGPYLRRAIARVL